MDIQQVLQQASVLAVYHNAAKSPYFQIQRHNAFNEVSKQDVQDWQEKVALFDKYWQYRDHFVDMLFKF